LKLPPLLKFFIFLFLTVVTTTLAGAEWMTGNYWVDLGQDRVLGQSDFWKGLQFSIPFLAVLTIHEFGHYFFSKKYKAEVTLPFYIPAWFGFIGLPSIGTMGAFIRLKSMLKSRTEYFDVGVAGPLAGFFAALGLLWYGFTHLPPLDYLFQIHPQYAQYGADYVNHVYNNPGINIKLGSNLLFRFFETYVASDPALIPNGYELMHYPYLFAGYLALFFTALNLLPIGQLDGGHILFSVVGWKGHAIISPILFCGFIFYAGLGSPMPIDFQYDAHFTDKLWENLFLLGLTFVAVSRLTPDTWSNFIIALAIFGLQYCLKVWFPNWVGYSGWTVFGIILGRFLGIYHPPVEDNRPLSKGRMAIAFFSLIVFVLCFSPAPFGQ
jgi:membrane-associated protease RseP (regulator of RpoE activity)